MRAIVLENSSARIAVEADVDAPVAGPGEVLCEALAVGLCHTDVAMIRGFPNVRAGYSPAYPLVLGHEFVARIVRTGPGVTSVSVGDVVVSGSHISCRNCKYCVRGESELCRNKSVIGLDVDGALSEQFVLPEIIVRRIDESIPLELAVLAEPFAVALHAVERAAYEPGDKVAVIGPGPVGLLTVGAMIAEGIRTDIIGLPSDDKQLQLGLDLGAAQAFTVDEALTTNLGAYDIVIEGAGHHAAVDAAIRLAGPGGRVVCVGLPEHETLIDTAEFAREEKLLIGSRAYDLSTWDKVPALLAASPGLARLVTHKLAMTDIEEGIRLVENRTATKVMLSPEVGGFSAHPAD
ncbi:MAG: alcohol dehydrogenase catalytic domain-containing protein [Propionibacteriaceae bacterium]|nr:alcohol dehydrogenase catalytic domain-containing protein [Propionibacteriaceae bacterium]